MNKKEDVILVTGATGNQGGATAGELLAHGFRVRAMTRNPESDASRSLAQRGAEVIKAELDDEASLKKALAGVWGVYAVQNTWTAGVEGEEKQGKLVAMLAREAGVHHFVYNSVASAHRKTGIPHFDNKWRVEETVRGLGFPSYTILRPVYFMENWLAPWFKPAIEQGKLTLGVRPGTRLQQVCVKDIGKFGLGAFEKHEQWNGKAIDYAGDEKNMSETAEVFSKVIGKKVIFEPTPIEEVRKFSMDFALMVEWFDRVGYDVDIKGQEKTYGIRPTSLQEWAASLKWA